MQSFAMRQFFVYILASKSRRLYIGVTNDLERRLYEHLSGDGSFKARYRIHRLVHFEATNSAIRSKKMALVESTNPTWNDLSESWIDKTVLAGLRSQRGGHP